MPKLVEGIAAKLRVPSGRRDVQIFDESLPGFGIRKFESGRAYYFVKFSVAGQQRKLSLGPVVPGVLGEKRRRASEILTKARIGEDVVANKRAASAKRSTTLGELVPRYLHQRECEFRPTTYLEQARYLEKYWMPLHPLAIEAIQRKDVVAIVDQVAEVHGKVAADRARTALSAFFAWAIDRSYLDLNPVQNIARRAQGEPRDRVLTETELGAVWRACEEDNYGCIVRLLILTGQRKREIGGLKWQEIDIEKRQIDLPGERTKNGRPHIVPLCDEAITVLAGIEARVGRDYVFGIGSGEFSGWSKAKARLDARVAYGRTDTGQPAIPSWTLHDIRRSVVTHLHELGFAQPHVVEAIVNHVSGHRGGVAGVYNKALYLSERRRALDLWGQYVSGLASGHGNNVIALRGDR